ncbi:MAG TPA: hypothetical protein VGG16_21520 [Streptosporangiaceae bacterium]|jgi:hypothetical protein
MIRIVRDSVSACQAEYARTEFKLNVLPQASGTLSHNLSGQDVFVIVLLVVALVAAVVLTAVWSSDGERRKAALAVLKLLLRWHP